MSNPDVTILNTFSEFLAMFEDCARTNTLSALPEAVFAEVKYVVEALSPKEEPNLYGKPLEDIPIPEGWAAVRESKIVCREMHGGEAGLYYYANHDGTYDVFDWRGLSPTLRDTGCKRIILRKTPTVVRAEPKSEPCVH
jgi:hypothetical protein